MSLPDKARRETMRLVLQNCMVPGQPYTLMPVKVAEIEALLAAADALDEAEAQAAAMRRYIEESVEFCSADPAEMPTESRDSVLSGDAGRALLARVERMEAALRLALSDAAVSAAIEEALR